MATSTVALIKRLDFLAPGFAALPVEDKEAALAIAAAYRPACLSEAQQDLAQVWYAAYILYAVSLSTGSGGGTTTPIPIGVTEEKEGDLSRKYGWSADQMRAGDPYGYYNNWQKLADICGAGAIMVGQSVRGGCCGNDGGYQDC